MSAGFAVDDFVGVFPKLAEAPGGALRLRQMVLGAALTGRLVPSPANGKSASRSAAISASEPRSVPATWAYKPVGEIADCMLGKMLDKAKHTKGTLRPYLRNINVRWFGVDTTDVLEMYFEDDELERYGTLPGDVLICEGGEPGRAAVWKAKTPTLIQKAIHRVRPSKVLDPTWLVLNLRHDSWSGRLSKYFTGATIKHFTGRALAEYTIPLPPLAEQKRIVERVDQLMALIDELEAKQTRKRDLSTRFTKASLDALTNAEGPEEFDAAWKRVVENWDVVLDRSEKVAELRRVVLTFGARGLLTDRRSTDDDVDALVADIAKRRTKMAASGLVRGATTNLSDHATVFPFRIPSGWRWVRLGEIGVFLGGGTPSKANTAFWRGPIPWVSPKDMKRSYIDDAEDHISKAAVAGSAVKLIPERSLLFVVRGMILAHSFPTAVTAREVTINQDMKALVVARADIADFLLLVCQDARDRVLRQVERSSHGTCRLDSEVIAQLPVALPPLEEQKRIVAKVEQLMKVCDELEANLRRAEERAAKLVEAVVQEMVLYSPGDAMRGEGPSAASSHPSFADAKGQTRLFPDHAEPWETYPELDRHIYILASTVTAHDRDHRLSSLGDIKIEKVAHIVEAHTRVDLGRKPLRKAAGPADDEALHAAADEAVKRTVLVVERGDAKRQAAWLPGANIHKWLSDRAPAFATKQSEIDRIINLFVPLESSAAEVAATLYAAWNDLIHEIGSPTDKQIIKAFYDWSERKSKYRRDDVEFRLGWMREKNLVPDGRARRVGALASKQ